MTREEKHLWYDFLKNLPYEVKRQKIIRNYIVDFYCAMANIVIEIDGAQHYEEEAKRKDFSRDKFLSELGIRVLRYSNVAINKNFEGVCHDIIRNIEERV